MLRRENTKGFLGEWCKRARVRGHGAVIKVLAVAVAHEAL